MRSIADCLDSQLSTKQLKLLKNASSIGSKHGAKLYLVGGTVRDIIIGLEPVDIDVAVENWNEGLTAVLASGLGAEIESSSLFGTARLSDGEIELDIAMSRSETYPHPGAMPVVTASNIEQDLVRRDFSINSIAVSLDLDNWGSVIDFHNGEADICSGIIRVLHSGSFVDDPTRILRALRYSARLGFEIEPETMKLIERDVNNLKDISGDRVRNELERLFAEENWLKCLSLAQNQDVLNAIHSSLYINQEIIDRLSGTGHLDSDLRLVAALSFLTPDDIYLIIERLNIFGKLADTLKDVAKINLITSRLESAEISNIEIYHLLSPLSGTSLDIKLLLSDSSILVQNIRFYIDELRDIQPILDGDDLIRLGAQTGPVIGEILSALLDLKLEGSVVTVEDEENYVRQSLCSE